MALVGERFLIAPPQVRSQVDDTHHVLEALGLGYNTEVGRTQEDLGCKEASARPPQPCHHGRAPQGLFTQRFLFCEVPRELVSFLHKSDKLTKYIPSPTPAK